MPLLKGTEKIFPTEFLYDFFAFLRILSTTSWEGAQRNFVHILIFIFDLVIPKRTKTCQNPLHASWINCEKLGETKDESTKKLNIYPFMNSKRRFKKFRENVHCFRNKSISFKDFFMHINRLWILCLRWRTARGVASLPRPPPPRPTGWPACGWRTITSVSWRWGLWRPPGPGSRALTSVETGSGRSNFHHFLIFFREWE